jgi:predicted RNase H-like nuclease
MSREVFVGFDSAWTDNVRKPGAVAALVFDDKQAPVFHPPKLATFAQASAFIASTSRGADYSLIAIDQPTVVPNDSGCRPVERVAASLISKLGGGVQPARRGGGGAQMFGDTAAIWRFLQEIDAVQDPFEARSAQEGSYLMEVFPALALPSFVPEIWRRGRSAKYNPAAALYRHQDWTLVCEGIASVFDALGIEDAAKFSRASRDLAGPAKADQDRLDALICLAIAVAWRRSQPESSAVIGDPQAGYVVTPVSVEIRAYLLAAAERCGVPFDQPWIASPNPAVPVSGRGASAPLEKAPADGTRPIKIARPRTPKSKLGKSATVTAPELRAFLIQKAAERQLVTYGEVAAAFGFTWTQGFGASLKAALKLVNTDNVANDEPMLMCLVVNQTSRIPGDGYFQLIGERNADLTRRRLLLDRELDRCAAWPWVDRPSKRTG